MFQTTVEITQIVESYSILILDFQAMDFGFSGDENLKQKWIHAIKRKDFSLLRTIKQSTLFDSYKF